MKTNQHKKILLINDHRERTGVGNYIFQVFRILGNLKDDRYSFDMLMQNMKRKYVASSSEISVQYRPFRLRGREFGRTYDLLSYYYFPKIIPKGYSLYHFSSQMMGNSVRYIHPAIVTCHDIIAFRFPGNHNAFSEYIRRKNIAAMTRASFIIFISDHTKNNFLKLFDFDESRTAVIYLGASDLFKPRDKMTCREELGLPLNRRIILHVGTEAPRKNPVTLFQVIKKLKSNIPDILLIRIGGKRPATKQIVTELSLTENVSYFGNLPEEKLVKFYNAADVMIFPSIYEGFGLPVLEALQSGCPLVASNATSIPEITGDAALLHDPMEVDSFVATIEKLLDNQSLREEYISKGLIQAKKFSWEKTARKTLEVYDKVCG